MSTRASLPARVALSATRFLAAVLLVLTLATYAVTALTVRQGIDQALLTALPLTANSYAELQEHAILLEEELLEHRHLRILRPDGALLFGDPSAPIAMEAVKAAVEDGLAFASRAESDERIRVRTGPDWWHALTPREHEARVLYATWGRRDSLVVLEMAAPVGNSAEALPHLLGWMLVLATGALLTAGLVVWRMADAIYQPLRTMTAVAGSIGTSTLDKRVPDHWDDKTLARLSSVFNQMLERLEEAFASQGRFVAAAAHELRGPIGALRAGLEVALRRERSPGDYRRALEGALNETVRLGALAEHLLLLARYERGAGLAMEQGLQVSHLLESAAGEVQRSKGAEVAVSVVANLVVDGDPVALERMLVNLMRNGVEAGGAPIRVEAYPAGGGVQISVIDRGRGIPQELQPRLFEPFLRGDPARGSNGGAGLGLAIVKSVVDAHKGRVHIDSELGRGTTVAVWLPIKHL